MNGIKILLLCDSLGVGGAETHVASLACGLRALGASVELLSSGGDTEGQLTREGFVCHRLPLRTRNPLRLLLLRHRLARLIREHRYDVLHAHARIPACLLRGIRAPRAVKIVTVHAQFANNAITKRLSFWGERTIAVSEDLRRYVCDTYRVPSEAVTVIPNGIDCRRFSPVKKPSDGALRVLFASRLDRDCSLGAELLLELAPSLCRVYPHLEIGIAGGGERFAEFCARAREINRRLERRAIVMHGQTRDMPTLLHGQDIFVGVSRAAMEAAACGCAVILCGNEGYLGILSEDNRLTASVSNFCCRGQSLPTAFRLESDLRLLADRAPLRRALASHAREWIVSAHHADAVCRQTLALYERALSKQNATRRILIGGYFGAGNVGDDAILRGFLDELYRLDPQIAVTAMTARPRRDRLRFGIDCISRKNPFSILCAIKRSSMLLCGGGSLLQNATSRRSLLYYLALLQISRRMGCKTVLYSAGIGPLRGEGAIRGVIRAVSKCDYISLRDPQSLRFLLERGIDPARLHEGADPALLLTKPSPMRGHSLLCAYRIPTSKPLLGVALRGTPRDRAFLWQSAALAVSSVCKRHDVTPLFLIFSAEDIAPAYAAAGSVGGRVIDVRDASDLLSLMEHLDLMLSMRLHALLLATLASVPAIGLSIDSFDQKIQAFCRLTCQEHLPYARPSVGELIDRMETYLSRSAAPKRAPVELSVAELQKKAKKDLENILQMLYNGRDP